jgi:hypothetical protein
MKVNKELLIPSINIILMITLIALASSCNVTKAVNKNAGHYGINPHICPAYN